MNPIVPLLVGHQPNHGIVELDNRGHAGGHEGDSLKTRTCQDVVPVKTSRSILSVSADKLNIGATQYRTFTCTNGDTPLVHDIG